MKNFFIFLLFIFVFSVLYIIYMIDSYNDIYFLDDKLNDVYLENKTNSIIDAENCNIFFDFGDNCVSTTNVILCKLLYDFDSIPLITSSGSIGVEVLDTSIFESKIKLSLAPKDGFSKINILLDEYEYEIYLYSSHYINNGTERYSISTLSIYDAWELVGFIESFDDLDNDKICSSYIETIEDSTHNNRSIGSIYGYLRWMDDNDTYHPLTGAKVKITYSGSMLGQYTITNSNGYYCIPIDNMYSTGFQCWIHIYSKNQNVEVVNGNNINHNVYEYGEELFFGNDLNYNYNKDFSEDNLFRDALSLFEALKSYYDYASTLTNITIPYCQLSYYLYIKAPNDGKHSLIDGKYLSNCIELGIEELIINNIKIYDAWDIVGHEFGHHLQNYFFNQNYFGQHDVKYNDIFNYMCNEGYSKYDGELMTDYSDFINALGEIKEYGAGLCLKEAWPTFFAIYSQDYFPNDLKTLCREDQYNFKTDFLHYENFNSTSNDFGEQGRCNGETDEFVVKSFLFKIWENLNNELWDNVSIDDNDLWLIMTEYNPTNFSEFVNALYDYLNINQDYINSILEAYKISASNINIERDACYNKPVTVRWDGNGANLIIYEVEKVVVQGNENVETSTIPHIIPFNNNSFTLQLFNSNDYLVIEKNNLASEFYRFTPSEWNRVLSYCFDYTFYIKIISYSTLGYVTGPYNSCKHMFYIDGDSECDITVGDINYYEKEFTVFEDSKFTFNISFETSGYRLIQTLGNSDTTMRLYYLYGNSCLHIDYDSGFYDNSMLYMYFQSNSSYRLEINVDNGNYVDFIKLVIIPTLGDLASNSINFEAVEDINQIPIGNTYYSTVLNDGYSTILLWRPVVSGYYEILLSSIFDNELYVIDPTSSTEIRYDIDYNYDYCIDEDNGTYIDNAGLNRYYDSYITYLIVIGKTIPNESGGTVSVSIYNY